MSRIGNEPVAIPAGVQVDIDGRNVRVKGPKGELSREMPLLTRVSKGDDGAVLVSREEDSRHARSRHGLTRTLIANMVRGVSEGFSKHLEIEGVGFRAQVQGQKVALSLGFASPKEYQVPEGVNVTEQGGTKLTVAGCDKQLVGEVAARLRGYFPAEPYKGKGIRYADEVVRRKVGKTVA